VEFFFITRYDTKHISQHFSRIHNPRAIISPTEFKHLSAWSDAILALDVVKNSVVDGLDDVYYRH
jgi:hypothetical protein